MTQQQGNLSSKHEVEPALERCPNCGGPLHFPADQAEAYCASCGIFVEVLRPLGPAPPEAKSGEGDGARLRTAKLYLELDSILAGDLEEESAEPPAPVRAEAVAPEVEPERELAEEDTEGAWELAEVPAAETSPVPAAPVAAEATGPEVPAESAATAASAASAATTPAQPRRWHRVLFYSGSILVAFGGSGLALGSVFHDVFRVPLFGFAYDAFGQLNVSALIFGAAFLLPGLAAMLVGARAGARPRRAVGG